MAQIRCSAIIPGEPKEVFNYLIHPENLHSMIKNFIDVQLLTKEVQLKAGSEVHFLMKRWGFLQPVGFQITECIEPKTFSYRQIEGLFHKWTHTQNFTEYRPGLTHVVDLVDYQLPLGLFGHLASDLFFKHDFKTILQQRLNRAAEHFDT